MIRLSIVLAIFFVLIGPTFGKDIVPSDLCRDEWFGLYRYPLEKLGYEHTKIEIVDFRGKKVYKWDSRPDRAESFFRSDPSTI